MRATQAQSESKLSQDIVAVGEVIADGLIRAETSLEKLAGLAPVFDKSGPGTITAGNASALTDGASAICLTAEDFAIEHKLTILGFIEALEFASVSPSDGLLMAPGLAVPRLMASIGADFSAVDVFEIHEAFAAQVLCNQSVWEKGWSRYPQLASLGVIPSDRRNIYGGSIALGHPFAATGGRLLMNACRLLADAPGKRALLSICAAGGGAGAVSVLRP
jgi:acetyl-CoA acetyltransferase family protein